MAWSTDILVEILSSAQIIVPAPSALRKIWSSSFQQELKSSGVCWAQVAAMALCRFNKNRIILSWLGLLHLPPSSMFLPPEDVPPEALAVLGR